MFETTRGLVLRSVRYKESDKILTVLTESEGKLTLRARGALRKGGKLAAATELYTLSEMTLFGNRGRWQLNEAQTVEQFIGLRENFSSLALAAYFAEVLDAISDEGAPDPAVLQLALNSLYALSRELCPARQIKAVFELRLMAITGYEPDLSGCASCGRQDMERAAFYAPEGAVFCPDCVHDAPGGVTLLLPETLSAMRHVVYSPPKKIFSFTLGEDALAQLAACAEQYLLLQLERGFSALDYWKKVKDL